TRGGLSKKMRAVCPGSGRRLDDRASASERHSFRGTVFQTVQSTRTVWKTVPRKARRWKRHEVTPRECRSSHLAPCPSPGPVSCLPALSPAVILDRMSEVTRILNAIEHGDPNAAGQLFPLVYNELRTLAAQKMAREAAGQTLQATALVHEAYLRLVDGD